MTIEIAPASAGDLDWVRGCVERAYEKYVKRIGRRPAPMDDDYVALIAAGAVHVLRADHASAGFIVLHREPDHLFVETVAVEPARQGEGLGRALMGFAEEEARRHGLTTLRLYTNEAMTENLAFYPRLGYHEIDRRTEHGFRRVYFDKRLA